MKTTPRFQKVALLAHIGFSVGWFGAVVPYVALAIAGFVSRDALMVRAAYFSMELIGWFVIVPLSIGALLSGLVQSLGTQWGLLRHWWIVAKLGLTVAAVVVLLKHMQEVSRVASMARQMGVSDLSRATFRPELVHAGGGLLVLFAAMILSVFKPSGLTPYGRRRVSTAYSPSRSGQQLRLVHGPVFTTSRPRWGRIIAYHAIALALLLAILHIASMHHH